MDPTSKPVSSADGQGAGSAQNLPEYVAALFRLRISLLTRC